MNARTRILVIAALIALGAIGLAVALMQCGGQPTPATGVPPTTQTGATEPATAAPGTTMAIAPDTPTAEPGASIPTPTLRPEVELARDLIEPGGQVTYSAGECYEILNEELWCSVIKSAEPITCTEWEALFPETNFYLVKTELYGGEFPEQPNWLIIKQDNKHYTAETFDRLLKANGVITITDENRELVAKAFALMTIPNYLEEEVVFTEWEEVEFDVATFDYTHRLRAWTKLQGLEVVWYFVFKDARLKIASGAWTEQAAVGDYIQVPMFTLPHPRFEDYRFRGE